MVDSLYLNFFALPILSAGIIMSVLAFLSWRSSGKQGEKYFSLLMVSCAIYALFYALEISSSSFYLMQVFQKMQYTGISFLPPLLILFAVNFSGLNHSFLEWKWPVLFIIPCIVLVLVFTNQYHFLFYKQATLSSDGLFPVISFVTGPWYWVHQIYAILAVIISNVLLFRMLLLSAPVYRKQIAIILCGSLAAWSAHIVYLLGIVPWGLDPIPFAFALSGLIIYTGLIRYRLFNLAPVAQRILFENLPDGVLVIDNFKRLVNCNKAASDFLGISLRDIGISADQIFWNWPELKESDTAVPQSYKKEIKREAGGKNIWYEAEFSDLADKKGKHQGRLILMRDISQRKEAEEISRRKERLLSAVATGTYELLKNPDHINASTKLFGLLGEAIGIDKIFLIEYNNSLESEPRTVSLKLAWVSDTATPIANDHELRNLPFNEIEHFIKPLMKDNSLQLKIKDIKQEELRKRLEAGNILSMLAFTIYVKESLWGFICFNDCKSEREWSDDEFSILLSFAGTLSTAIGRNQLESELALSVEKAEAANRAKSEFLANMSHEIRTPLNGVIGFTELLMKTQLSKTQSHYMHTVNQSANSLLDLINDVLDFSKIEAGKLDLNIEKVDLHELAGQIVDLIKYKADEKKLEVLLNLSTETPKTIWADPVRLRQVMVNLAGNAIKFTEKGEIEIKISATGYSPSSNQTSIEFSVRDTGIGISKENQKKIFEAFSQEDASTTRKYGGTGLGLTISNKLLTLMNTQLEVESVQGKGSRFYFTIQLKAEKEDIQENELDAIHEILVVDDNENNRIILKEMLKSFDIRTDFAASGIEALGKIAKNGSYDAMIIDYHMPQMDGLVLIEHIREKLQLSPEQQPIIFLHGSEDNDKISEACSRLGVWTRLIKPIKIGQLVTALSTIRTPKSESTEKTEVKISEPINKAIKVLLVEDNEINMLLIKTITSNILPVGEIFEVTNGYEAVQATLKHKPDIIFMDIQMPGISGYDASREIRKTVDGKDIHIVALTAGTTKGERERCLDAGMNDYITKPVISDSIRNVIWKWLVDTNKSDDMEPSLKNAAPVPNVDKELLKLHFGGNKAVYDKVLQKFRNDFLDQFLPTIHNALNNNNLEDIKFQCHFIKGSASSLFFHRFASLATKMETIEQLDKPKIVNILEEMKNEVSSIYRSLDVNT